jgi:DNA-binding NarL/FixJ family response regulator
MNAHPRILIADDHKLVAEALAHYLRDDYELVGIVEDGEKLVGAVHELKPDLVVADVSMPVMGGVEALRRIRANRSADALGQEVKVILLTMHGEVELACEALRAGASGFILKHSAGEELVAAIGQVLGGHVYISPTIAKDVIAALAVPAVRGKGAKTDAGALTPRQREVLKLVAEGKTMKEIAADLNLSRRTVETHKYEMMDSLGVHSTAELVQYAMRHGVVA